MIEQTDREKYIYYDDTLISEDELEYQNAIENKSLVEKYLRMKFGEREYILEEAEIDQEKSPKYRIFLVVLSTCLDEHYGNLVLKCFCQQLTELFHQFLRIPNYGEKMELAQDMLNGTGARIEFLLHTMFKPLNMDFINSLSGEYYEKAECKSNMVFLPYGVVNRLEEHDLIYHIGNIKFVPENSRLLRKLLQMTQQNLCLVLGEMQEYDSFQVLGICKDVSLKKILENKDGIVIPCIRVEIKGHMLWDMFLNKNYIFTCQNGHYKIEHFLEEKYLKEKLKAYFGNRQDDYRDLVKSIIQSQNQGHGTMLVIMENRDARAEVQRLGCLKYGLMEKSPRTQDEINCLNAIDGSVFIDTDGKVHGIGMILDGISLEPGSLARGARYNSAIKYRSFLRVSKRKKRIKAMILIVSEDGSVDFVLV